MADRTDRELLELAAKAAGIKGQYAAPDELGDRWGIVTFLGYGHIGAWNPITRAGDAFALLIQLGMQIDTDYETLLGEKSTRCIAFQHQIGDPIVACERHGAEGPITATCRAIVRTAAEIGATR